ncbi:TPA: hypothetical protein DEP96_03020 [Candidatus Uhrbacteria bacterium]|nr:hypothetical protein [Candidatus Uhrbacteria bacterium]
MNSVNLFGVRIDSVDAAQTRGLFAARLNQAGVSTAHLVCTPNPEFLLAARRDSSFKELLNNFDLNLPDGVGLRFASAALTDQLLRNRVPGVQALLLLAELCAESRRRLLLLGEQKVSEQGAAELRLQWPRLDVVVIDPGLINRAGELSQFTLDAIDCVEPAVIAVGLGQGKQEACIWQYRARWPIVKIMIGVGGACAMIGKALPRAPKILQRLGLEWLWRLVIEPQRFSRIWRAVVIFPLTVTIITLREHRFCQAVRRTIPEIFLQLIGR